MSTSVDQSFIKHFQADVHMEYQRTGSKLRNTVRSKSSIVGASTTFQTIGKGTASTKARHGKVPVMNIDHTPTECTLADYYAGDWVDTLDEIKTNTNERLVIARAGAYALGRKTDELIIEQLDTSTNYAGDGADGLTKTKVLEAFEMLGGADVPDDGERYAIIGWKQWSDLLGIEEFGNADYVGDDDLPWKGTQANLAMLAAGIFFVSGGHILTKITGPVRGPEVVTLDVIDTDLLEERCDASISYLAEAAGAMPERQAAPV